LKQIDAVTLEQINEAAKLVTDPKIIALSAVGETKSEAFYKKMLEYLN
jgi:predicted Zn-dependent peptidase